MRQSLGDYKSAATAYKRAIAEAPTADLGLLEVNILLLMILTGNAWRTVCKWSGIYRAVTYQFNCVQ